jgi:flagellar biosynthesis protein FliR
MKTLVTPQRKTEQRTCVPFFPIAQRVCSFLFSFPARQGATITKEVRTYNGAQFT